MRLTLKTGRIAGLAAAAMAATMAAMFATTPARADVVGELNCNIAGGPGQIVVSSRAVSCVFHSGAGPAELYNGSFNRLGVDVGALAGGRLIYQVVSIGQPGPGALAGEYVGGGFDLTLGAGGGLNALVGGGGSLALQPISATSSTGTNIAAGATALRLAYVGPEAGPVVSGGGRRIKHRRVYRGAHPRHAGHHHHHHHHHR